MEQDYSTIYALVKNNEVINVIVFEDEEPMFIDALKQNLGLDYVVSGSGQEFRPSIGQVYDPTTNKLSPNSFIPDPSVTLVLQEVIVDDRAVDTD